MTLIINFLEQHGHHIWDKTPLHLKASTAKLHVFIEYGDNRQKRVAEVSEADILDSYHWLKDKHGISENTINH